jgi:hypothetical protein
VRAIVDLPVPASPFSQNRQGLSEAVTQARRSPRRETRVPGVHIETGAEIVEAALSAPVAFQAADAIGPRELSRAAGNVNHSVNEEYEMLTDVRVTLGALCITLGVVCIALGTLCIALNAL